MRNLQILSVGAVLVAIFARYAWDWWNTVEHCYTSINTLSDTVPSANCFQVSASGLFKNVYTRSISSKKSNGYVLPGLWDGHGHVLQYGEMLHSVDLFQSQSLQEVRDRLAHYVEANPGDGEGDTWIRGIGWDQAAFNGVMPTAADLEEDSRLRGKFIMLDRVDVHCVWVSEAVLQRLPDPLPDHVDGGEIVRDPGLGVFCDNAIDIIRAIYPEISKERKSRWLDSAMTSLNSLGIVGVHDAGVIPNDLALYEEKVKTPSWTVRIYAMFECAVRNTVCQRTAKQITTPNSLLTVRSVKLFADGALGSWGSAMLEPYSDRPDDTGSLLVNGSTLTFLAQIWAKAGYQVNIHAIGDRANRNAIDALEAALKLLCPKKHANLKQCQQTARFRIEHAQIIHPDDQKRMFELGLIPSIQPTHATSDMAYAEDRLGSERTSSEAYRMKSLLALQPVLGSDFPVEPPDVFQGIFAAVARRSPRTGRGKDGAENGWHVEETLTVKEALLGFTRNAARAAFMEGKAGVIEKGAFADWIVLDQDVAKAPVEALRSVRVRETWVGGKRVYKRD